NRSMLRVVGTRIFEVEILRLHVVELDRRTLPLSADRVRYIKIDLWSVERAVLLVDRVVHARAVERGLELCLGMVPGGHLAEEFVWAGRQFRRKRKSEIVVDALHEANQPLDLVADLILGHETVRIVL